MSPPPERINLFFRLAAAAAAVFVITIFALVATMFGDPNAPPTRFLNVYGGTLIAVEAAAAVLLGLLAMTVDRLQTLRQLRSKASSAQQDDRSVLDGE